MKKKFIEDGKIYNEEFTNFQKELNSLPTPSEKDLEQKAEEFIVFLWNN